MTINIEELRFSAANSVRDLALLPSEVLELIDRLEAAEKELAELRSSMKFRTSLIGRTEAERDTLRAKITEMERQEPVMWANSSTINSSRINKERGGRGDQHTCSETQTTYHDTQLFALPGAQTAPSVPDDWMQHAARMAALARKLREPDWHFESIREMQRELCALEEAALAAAPEAKP